jgi:Chaperone of endosialidase
MERITSSTRIPNKWGPGRDGFGDGNPTAGTPSTQLNMGWFDNLQEEVARVIELAGLTLDGNEKEQLNEAIDRKIGASGFFVLKAGDTMTGPLLNSSGRFIASTVADPSITLWPSNNAQAWGIVGTVGAMQFGLMTGAGALVSSQMTLTPNGLTVQGTIGLGPPTADLYLASDGSSRGLNFKADVAGDPFGAGVWQWTLTNTSRDLGWGTPVGAGGTRFAIAGGGPGSFYPNTPGTVRCYAGIGWPLLDNQYWSLQDNPTVGINVWSQTTGVIYGLIPLATSDMRIKQKIADYAPGLDAIRQIAVMRYRYRGNAAGPDEGQSSQFSPEVERIGVSAQAVETVIPEMVFHSTGYIDGEAVNDMRCITTEPLIWTLVNAVKELADRLDTIERVRALERR